MYRLINVGKETENEKPLVVKEKPIVARGENPLLLGKPLVTKEENPLLPGKPIVRETPCCQGQLIWNWMKLMVTMEKQDP